MATEPTRGVRTRRLTGTERVFTILNMRSTPTTTPDETPRSTTPAGDDRNTPARIRDAAIACFADHGVAATTIRAIAARAEVSPALVMHHFGSKEALREACDEHVAAVVRRNKHRAMAAGPGFDPLAAMRDADSVAPLLAYLARTLADGTPQVAALFDEMVDDAVAYMQEGVDTGMLRPTEYPRGRATVLVAWTLGALVLHDHVERLLGVDLTGEPADTFAVPDYLGPIIEIYSRGVLTDAAAEQLQHAFLDASASPFDNEEAGHA